MSSNSKAVNLNLIPPIPDLRLALVGVVDGRYMEMSSRLGIMTGDKMRRLAKMAIQLSQKQCFFCKKDSDPQLKRALKQKVMPWGEMKLCSCLADLREGYREYFNWKKELQAIPSMVKEKELNPRMLMYSDKCIRPGCSNRIEVTAIMIANSVNKYGSHQQMRKCKSCRDEAVRLAENRKHKPEKLVAEPAEKSNAAFPSKKHRRTRKQFPGLPPLSATVGEIQASHGDLSRAAEESRVREEQRAHAKQILANDPEVGGDKPVMITVKRAN